MVLNPKWLAKFYDKTYENWSLEQLCKAPVMAISGISDSDARDLKETLGIETVEDLATSKYIILAQGINSLSKSSGQILDKVFRTAEYDELRNKPIHAILGVSKRDAELLKRAFGIDNIQELAENKYVTIAQLTVSMNMIEAVWKEHF